LCFSGFVFFAGTACEGLGEPTRSRAISRITVAAENVFFFRFLAIQSELLAALTNVDAAGCVSDNIVRRIFASKAAKVQ
jgi:hypothetical protein